MSGAGPASLEGGLLRAARPADAAALLAIYAPIVRETAISFEYEPPSEAQMAQRVQEVGAEYPWLLLELDGAVAGYAYATTWRSRVAYRYTAEVAVYVAPSVQRRGVARRLYGALWDGLVHQGRRTAVAGITLPNAASVALHESLGFAPVGCVPRAGWKHGRWWDLGMWSRSLSPAPPPKDVTPVAAVYAHFGW